MRKIKSIMRLSTMTTIEATKTMELSNESLDDDVSFASLNEVVAPIREERFSNVRSQLFGAVENRPPSAVDVSGLGDDEGTKDTYLAALIFESA